MAQFSIISTGIYTPESTVELLPLHPCTQRNTSHPHGEGWGGGETWGKFAGGVGGGGGHGGKFTREVPHLWGKVHSDLVKSPPMPHPAQVGGGAYH